MTTIRDHYTDCYIDYKRVWRADKTKSLHFGYYEAGKETHEEAVIKMIEVLAHYGDLSERDVVLDAGCGWGGSSAWLVENIGCVVHSIDLLDSQLELAKKVVGSDAYLARMDFCKTGYKDDVFSIIWVMESSCYAEDKLGFLKEARRLLTPGGTLVIADGFCRYGMSSELSGWGVSNLVSPRLFKVYLTLAGFKNVETVDITPNVIPSLERLHNLASSLMPLGIIMRLLGLRTRAQMANLRMSKRFLNLFKDAGYSYLMIKAEA